MGKMPAWAKHRLITADIDRVDMCPEGCNSAAFIKLVKEKKEDNSMNFEDIKKQLTPESAAIVEAEIEKVKTEAATAAKNEMKGEMDKKDEEIDALKKKGTVAPNKEEAMKKALESCDPIVKAMYEEMQAQKTAAEALATVAKEKAENDAAVAMAKELSHLAVKEEELVGICKSLGSLEDKGAKVIAILKAASNVNGGAIPDGKDGVTSIFKAVGTGQQEINALVGATAWDKFDNVVKSIMKEAKIDQGAATLQVMKEKPELYQAYLDEEASK